MGFTRWSICEMRRAIFLDRDGVINRNRADYVKCWQEFEFLPRALEGIRKLAALDVPIIIITNQSIIGRGLVTSAVVDSIHQRMQQAIEQAGGRIDAIYYCPHHPEAGCDCRKPQPGLLLRASRELSLDLSHSYLIGDAESDVQTAMGIGCLPIFVKSGRGNDLLDHLDTSQRTTLRIEDDLESAAHWLRSRWDDSDPVVHTLTTR
jgi:D-glycero-D-manno-heptose 1,7-bisphosphate phosphatase